MKVCVPVSENNGLRSSVYSHFGSAPMFMLVDTDNGAVTPLENGNQHHAHGMCQPLAALAGHPVEVVLVGGIGRGALMKLEAGGIQVYLANEGTVEQAVQQLKAGLLRRVTVNDACGGHGGGHGCH